MVPKYEVAIFGPTAARYRNRLTQVIRTRIRELGTGLLPFVKFLGNTGAMRSNPKSPLVAVYFGGVGATHQDLTAARHLAGTSAVVLPIVARIRRFTRDTPQEFHGINGIALDSPGNNLDSIGNLVLENLGLLRKSRRLFISYRRDEASGPALQIRHSLDARGYDVFLDTHSVPKGDLFQEVLWQRLADSDVMVLLDTPRFLESRWTREELAQAEALTIGVLQILWPAHRPAPYTDLCQRLYLTPGDLLSSGLTGSALKRITTSIETLRARSLAARHDNIVREFCDAASSVGAVTHVQPERYILAHLKSGKRIAAVPAVGVPDAHRYHDAHLRFANGGRGASQALLIYDHRGLRKSWGEFLRWLDGFLPVKAIRVTDVAGELASR